MDELSEHRDRIVDGPDGDERIAAHVAGCLTCQETMVFLKRLAADVAALPSWLALVRPLTIARAVPVRSLDGNTVDLRTSLQGPVTVVAFLSRFCAPAIEVIPDLQRLATRLGQHGVRTVAIFDETSSSAELSAFLRKHHVSLPVLLDHDKSASNAFQQWGTPYFYVVDGLGRIMSEPTSEVDQLLVNADAVRVSAAFK